MVIYLDGANLAAMRELGDKVSGYTSNPSLMKQSGITDYREFGRSVLDCVQGKPISFEVFADDIPGMYEQAQEIASWGDNVYVKIPITNTQGESTAYLMRQLGMTGVKVNATAIMTFEQIETAARSLIYAPAILSIFCGRIADTGRDPVPFITKAQHVKHSNTKILWASTREVLNVKQAQACGCDIITMTPDLIKKMGLFNKDLAQYSLETVQQFFNDAKGLTL